MKKLLKLLIAVMVATVVAAIGTVFCYAVGPSGYSGFDQLISILKDILKIVGGFMAVIAAILFAYAMVVDRPESKLMAVKVLGGGAMLFMISIGMDKFFT